MKTDFDKFRKCYHAELAVAVFAVLFAFGDLILLKLHPELALERWYDRILLWVITFGSGIIIAGSLLMWRYSKCPRCGKSVLPFWGNRKMVKRILNRKPNICARCGEEVETD